MEPKHVVPDQLVEDENYIERLFPKCPAKQKASAKRALKGTSNPQQRKQTRLKVHQHSRRELEARRNKIKPSASTSMINKRHNHASSESSDEKRTPATNRINNKNLKNSNNYVSHSTTISNMQYASGGTQQKQPSLPSSTTASTQLTPTTTTPTTSTNHSRSPVNHRRSGNYAASQNLLQQLQKSQSSHYNNTNNAFQGDRSPPPAANVASIDSRVLVETEPQPVKELAVGLNKISLTISCDQEELCDSNYARTESPPAENLRESLAQQTILQPSSPSQAIPLDQISKETLLFSVDQAECSKATKDARNERSLIQPPAVETSVLTPTTTTATTSSPSLRHHSLPNEICHYSVVRTSDFNSGFNTNPIPRGSARKPSVRFGDLTDKESENEELEVSGQHSTVQQPQQEQNDIQSLSKESIAINGCLSVSSSPVLDEGSMAMQHNLEPSSTNLLVDSSVASPNELEQTLPAYEAEPAVTKDLIEAPIKTSSEMACDQEVLCDVGYNQNDPSNVNFKHRQQFRPQLPTPPPELVPVPVPEPEQQQQQQQQQQPQQQQQQPQLQLQDLQQHEQQERQQQVEKSSTSYDSELSNPQTLSDLVLQPVPNEMDEPKQTSFDPTITKFVDKLDSSTTITPAVQNSKPDKYVSSESVSYQSSIVKRGTIIPPGNSNIRIPTRSSSIRFNTFSDNESGPEDSTACSGVQSIQQIGETGKSYTITKKCDILRAGSSSVNRNLTASSSSSTLKNIDEDSLPTTKTALIFPRLDEGLSSDAESNEDDLDEEDERAMDADVDADDDEDDDDDAEDDIDNDALNLDRNISQNQLSQSSVECFLRHQQQQVNSNTNNNNNNKPQNRLIGSVQQQHVSTMMCMTADNQNTTNDVHQVKAPGTAFGGYTQNQPNPLDHNDLKSMTNYSSNQNGSQNNYWVGAKSNQQPSISPQATSSQQFNQRNHSDSNSFNRDEVIAKVASRPSSDTDNETDRLLGSQRNDQLTKLTSTDATSNNSADLQTVSNAMKQNSSSREVLIEGVLFNVKYLGSTHSDCEGRSEKEDRIHQAEMAVHEVKFRNGLAQAATEVQLFISTEKIMVLDDKHRKIMMDHSLRTISYIADIGDAIVLIVRKKGNSNDTSGELGRPISKISCHVFESSESHTITKSISQAFQVAYTELLKANGTGDTSSYLPKELDYQEVLNSQEMSTDELEMFARKENQREVIVPKEKGEILGLSIVESGWGSVLPTVVIASLKNDGPAYRCKRLSIGDQILSVNGISLVGLPLAECQEILRKTKNQRVARLSVVPCPITVEVKIKRPDTKYQLGFSVQNGVICSLLRGGIAERGGVRVGHRIMSINGTTVVGVPHEKIVTLLASSVGEIRMKTCLTSLYRLILGEENPVHF